MTPSQTYLPAIAQLARARGLDLPPLWDAAASSIAGDEVSALNLFCEASGWPPARALDAHIRAHGFPILAYSEGNGWAVAKKFEAGGFVAVQQGNDNLVWRTQDVRLFDVLIPTPAGQQHHARALDVFLAAILKRKSVLVTAGLATLVINVIALATSLFSMQVYDRVLASQSEATLLALTLISLFLIAIYGILEGCRSFALIGLGRLIDRRLSSRVFEALFVLGSLRGSDRVGAQPLRDLEQVRSFIST